MKPKRKPIHRAVLALAKHQRATGAQVEALRVKIEWLTRQVVARLPEKPKLTLAGGWKAEEAKDLARYFQDVR